jgi:hypothetical protein
LTIEGIVPMKLLLHTFGIAVALAPLAPLAAADLAEDCRQMAAEEAVPVEDLADYIAECVAMLENDYPDESEGIIPGEEEPEAEVPEAGESPPQE